MPRCPQCNKTLVNLARRCPSCLADLDLLVDYVGHLQSCLDRADNLTRGGQLGPAIWAYLEVLEVDPENAVARQQVGQVVTAVRQFDRLSPGRRWALGKQSWLATLAEGPWFPWLMGILLAVLLFASFLIGYGAGTAPAEPSDPAPQPPPMFDKRDNTLGGRERS